MMEYSKFAVSDVPYCVWDPELRRTNLEFIEEIDPAYYEYIAGINKEALQDDDGAQYAAMAIRIAYFHGLETLFALLCACAQAPGLYDRLAPKVLIRTVERLGKRNYQSPRPDFL